MARIAIMQGRLVPPEGKRFQSFPRSGWRGEFGFAKRANLDAIEWIYDVYGAEGNPIASDEGVAELDTLRAANGIEVVSLCADYFMDKPIVRATSAEREELTERLCWLIGRASRVGIKRIVLPFVDASRVRSESDAEIALKTIRDVLPLLERWSVEIHLEMDLAPPDYAGFLTRIDHPLVRVNYDSGNSSSLGFDPSEEFAAYGKRIGSVHIKDRKRGGGTVPLGTGDADLPTVFHALKTMDYQGDYVLQAARGEDGGEVALAARNVDFIRRGMAAADDLSPSKIQ